MRAQQWFTHPIGLALSAVVVTFLWGSAMPAIKIGYQQLQIETHQTFEQWLFAGYRFTLAGLMLVLLSWVLQRTSHQRQLTGQLSDQESERQLNRWQVSNLPRYAVIWRVTRLAAVQTLLQYLFFYIGLSLSTGMKGAIISGATCFFQMAIARAIDKSERFTLNKTVGLVLGFAGVAIVTVVQGGLTFQLNIGDLCLMLSAFFGGLGNVMARQEARHLPVLWLTGRQMLLGGLILTAIGASSVGIHPFVWDANTFGLLLYLAFLSAAGFGLWNTIMKYNSVGKVSMYLFLIPLFGVWLSALFLGEQWNMWIVAALVLVISGIFVVNRTGTPKEKSKSVQKPLVS